jgi:hypothetical protein
MQHGCDDEMPSVTTSYLTRLGASSKATLPTSVPSPQSPPVPLFKLPSQPPIIGTWIPHWREQVSQLTEPVVYRPYGRAT